MSNLAVYVKNEAGEIELIERGLTSLEAIEKADEHYNKTGRSAVNVNEEE